MTNGWAYAVRRLPIQGRLVAVDKQSLREENLGPYVLSTTDLGRPKVELLKRSLEPLIHVTPRPEPLEFYRIRLERGLVRVPELVIAGLDDILARHSVQRLWPDILIDMAGGGTTTQLVVHHAGGAGICLLEALRPPAGTADFAERMAAATGLSAERIRSCPTDLVSEEDVEAAAPEHRGELETARRLGRPLCGRITDHNLYEEGYSDDFTPSGAVRRRLLGHRRRVRDPEGDDGALAAPPPPIRLQDHARPAARAAAVTGLRVCGARKRHPPA